jgi:hypothetical protein
MAITERRSSSVSISSEVQEAGFTIMASAEAFEILSDRIYPNKIKAVVRELSTNAVDATVDARKVSKIHRLLNENIHISTQELAQAVNDNDEYAERERTAYVSNEKYNLADWVEQPPMVHLPNRLEPYFSVRDYGTGLSHDFIMKLYTTYFWSDKKTSNDYTGCLGLGSKSPFAYTDHFTVTSYWNGEKRMYNAHLNEDHFPAISTFVDDDGNELIFPTDEPNGLEVSFAVKAYDFEEFANEAKKLYPYFRMYLNVVGNTTVSQHLENIKNKKKAGTYYNLQGDKVVEWGFRPSTGYDVDGPRAIMGNIAYPITLSNTYEYDSIVRQLLHTDIDIVFPVGSLQITPSREQLSYKTSTVQAISEALKQIASELADKFNEKIQKAESLWAARCQASDLFHHGDFQGFVSLLSLNKLQWHGQELGSTLHINFDKEDGFIIHRFSPGKEKHKEVRQLPLHSEIVIYEIDLPKGSFTRCDIKAGMLGKQIYAVEFINKAARDKFIQTMGMPDTTTFPGTSTLPKPTVNTRSTYSNDSLIFKHTGSTWAERQYRYWGKVNSTFKLDDGGIYVEMFRYKATNGSGQEISPQLIGEMISWLSEVDDNQIEVFGVRKRMVKQFKRSDDWVDINEYTKKLLQVEATKNNLGIHIANRKEISETSHFDALLRLAIKINDLNDGPLKKFLNNITVMAESRKLLSEDKASNYQRLAGRVGFVFTDQPTHKTSIEIDEILKKYPMLKFALRDYFGPDEASDLIEYANSLDKQE